MPQHWPTPTFHWANSSQPEQFRGDHGGKQFQRPGAGDGRRADLRGVPAGPVDDAARLPYSLKVLLENLVRNDDGALVTAEQVDALAD
jgi:hypothetical protein